MARLNYSRQRESIKNYVMSRHDHPTAEQVYEAVKKEYPSVSRGTIYRNLSLLADRGEIVKLSRDGDVERFDGNTQLYYHFVSRNAVALRILRCHGWITWMYWQPMTLTRILKAIPFGFTAPVESAGKRIKTKIKKRCLTGTCNGVSLNKQY